LPLRDPRSRSLIGLQRKHFFDKDFGAVFVVADMSKLAHAGDNMTVSRDCASEKPARTASCMLAA